MADLPITALTTAGQLSSSDLLYVAIPNPLSPIGFSLCKMTSAQFGLFLNNQLLFASDLDTDSKTIIGAINELKAGGGGASVIQLTAAEYAELTPAEKINGSIYKLTDKAIFYCLDEEYHAVKELTSAQYNALPSAEKNNGSIYIITDASITADDVEYTSGVSVGDKLDDLSKSATQTITFNGVPFVFTRKGNVVMVSVSHNSQVAFSNAWTNLGTLNDDLKPSGYTFCGMIFPAGHFLQLRIIPTTGEVDIASDTSANMYPQGSTTYLV